MNALVVGNDTEKQIASFFFCFLVHLEGEKFKEIPKSCAEWKVVHRQLVLSPLQCESYALKPPVLVLMWERITHGPRCCGGEGARNEQIIN